MITELLRGHRRVSIHKQRMRKDWAEAIKHLVEVHYPKAGKFLPICDNLNTHNLLKLLQRNELTVWSRDWRFII